MLIAEKVIGLCNLTKEKHLSTETIPPNVDISNSVGIKEKYLVTIPKYSTDIAAAWEVVEKLDLFATHGLYKQDNKWCIDSYYFETGVAETETAAHAICLAALAAVEEGK